MGRGAGSNQAAGFSATLGAGRRGKKLIKRLPAALVDRLNASSGRWQLVEIAADLDEHHSLLEATLRPEHEGLDLELTTFAGEHQFLNDLEYSFRTSDTIPQTFFYVGEEAIYQDH